MTGTGKEQTSMEVEQNQPEEQKQQQEEQQKKNELDLTFPAWGNLEADWDTVKREGKYFGFPTEGEEAKEELLLPLEPEKIKPNSLTTTHQDCDYTYSYDTEGQSSTSQRKTACSRMGLKPLGLSQQKVF